MQPVIDVPRPPDEPSDRPAFELAELIQLCSTCARRLRAVLAARADRHRLGDAAFAVLWACYQAPASGLSQKQLARCTDISPAHVSGLVEQLRHRHLLTGDRSPTDRRLQVWRVTSAGREFVEVVVGDLHAWVEQLSEHWPAEHRRQLAELLGEMNALLATDVASPLTSEAAGRSGVA